MRAPLWPLLCVALSGCAACGPPVIAGEVRLAIAGVDPDDFATLELRGYATRDLEDAPDLEPAYTGSIPIADVATFPYEYFLEERRERAGYHVFLRAWLARDPNAAIAARAGEPYGKTLAMLCDCASELPPYASDVVIVIDSIAPTDAP